MAIDAEEFDHNFENLKISVRTNFARIYASLKARELKTLRQLDAIRKQCQDNKELKRNCVQNIQISYENESTLLDNINSFGVIDLEKLNFDSSIFTLEDYISPNDDHLYSYKCIEDLKTEQTSNLDAIEEAALRQITSTDDCVCYVHIRSDEVSKRFRDVEIVATAYTADHSLKDIDLVPQRDLLIAAVCDDKSEGSDIEEVKKIEPTDEWLNSIKNQTETEPSQVTDVMEHSTISCS